MNSLVLYKIKKEDHNTISLLAFSPDGTINISEVEYAIQKEGESISSYQVEKRFTISDYGDYIGYVKKDNVVSTLKFQLYGLVSPCHNQSFTMSYTLDTGMWASFHSYLTASFISQLGKLWHTTSLGFFYEANKNKRGVYYGVLYPSWIDQVLSNDLVSKRYKSIKIQTDSFSENRISKGNAITHIRAYNYRQATKRTKLTSSLFLPADGTNQNSSYDLHWLNYNKLRNEYKTGSKTLYGILDDFKNIEAGTIELYDNDGEGEPLYSPFLILRLETDNVKPDKLIINAVTADYIVTNPL